jgi:2-hydroxychromene-2-carboxylate isomerase
VKTVTFYYDFSSPFSYLGATQVERVCAARGATVRWRPFLLGALFKSIGTPDVPL